MTQRKVLLLSKLFPDNYRPIYGKLIQKLAAGLQKRGDIDLQVVKPIPNIPRSISFLSNRLNIYANHPHMVSIEGLDVIYEKFIKYPGLFNYYEDKSIFRAIEKYLLVNNVKPDVIYTHWPYPEGIVANELCKRLGAKCVLHFHASNPDYFLKNHRVKGLVKGLLKEADQTIFVSKGIMNESQKFFEVKNPTYLYNGIDDKMFNLLDKENAKLKLNIDNEKKIILSVSYLKPNKGVDLVLQSMANCKIKNFDYYIVGWGEELARLRELAQKLGLSERVHFVGRIPYEKVSTYMQAADIFVLPSRAESFGQVFVESLLSGTPAIGTCVGGIPEIIQKEINGFIVEPGNIFQISEAIDKGLEKQWNSKEISESAQKFTLDIMVNNVGNCLIKI